MITVSSATAAMLYLGLTLLVLLGLWTYQHYQSRKKKIVTMEKTLCVCEYCHFAYLAVISKRITKCPQCHCFNKAAESSDQLK